MDCKLEGVVVPVEDVDRSKRFYAERLGFQLNGEQRLAALVA
jgi:catechol 2,3-dioxygenase-like lactoylglutathione lyase family enzyme